MKTNYLMSNQKGAALAVGLIFLVMATIVTVAGMRGAHMQERMTSNMSNKAVAFMAAEIGAATFRERLHDHLQNTKEWPYDDVDARAVIMASAAVRDGFGAFELVPTPHPGGWQEDGVEFWSIGRAIVDGEMLGEARIRVKLNGPGLDLGGLPPPQAAVSCFGGSCTVQAGAASQNSGNFVSGQDHSIPPATLAGEAFSGCQGAAPPTPDNDSCRGRPTDKPPVPSVFLDQPEAGSIDTQGNNPNNKPFCGKRRDGVEGIACGNSVGAQSIWDPTAFAEGEAPDWEQYFGAESFIETEILNAPVEAIGHDWGYWSDPKLTYFDSTTPDLSGNANAAGILVIDGEVYSEAGTGLFAGMVIVRNCGTINGAGNWNIYGTVLVDATGCGPDYEVFTGNGTPGIWYSSEAVKKAGSLFGTVGDTGILVWREEL